VSSINDKNDWKTVKNAFSVIDFDANDIEVRRGAIFFRVCNYDGRCF